MNISAYRDLNLFEMLKSSEHEKLWHYLTYKSSNFRYCSEVRSADPPIWFCYKILWIGSPGFKGTRMQKSFFCSEFISIYLFSYIKFFRYEMYLWYNPYLLSFMNNKFITFIFQLNSFWLSYRYIYIIDYLEVKRFAFKYKVL